MQVLSNMSKYQRKGHGQMASDTIRTADVGIDLFNGVLARNRQDGNLARTAYVDSRGHGEHWKAGSSSATLLL